MFSEEETRRLTAQLMEGAASVGVTPDAGQAARLIRFLGLLLDWNRKINLTAITDPAEAVEHHLIDALAASPLTADLHSVMDIGTGGGIPGIPLAVLNPNQQWVLVETVGKKVGFLKAAAAALGLKNVRSIQARAEGHPTREGLPLCEGAISRAFTAAPAWFDLAQNYVTGPRAVIAMLGAGTEAEAFAAANPGFRNVRIADYRLPRSGIARQVMRASLPDDSAGSGTGS